MKTRFHMSLAAFALAASLPAAAVQYRVSQESAAGVGDFDANVLGTVGVYNTGMTASAFYAYGNPDYASYNGDDNGGPAPVSSLSQVFLVNASDGLSLFVVHDNINDGSGGRTSTRWNLAGDTAGSVVVDDPGETIIVSGGGTQFDSTKNWAACCTDGYVIGSLSGNFELLGQFRATPTGITTWRVTDPGGSNIGLVLATGQRVRIDTVPSGGLTAAMLGLALIGLTGFRRFAR